MRKSLPILSVLYFILFVFCLSQISCKKSSGSGSSVSDEVLKQTLINWTTLQKGTLSSNKNFVDTLQKVAAWDSLTVKTINVHESVIFVPTALGKNTTGLVFIMNSQNMLVEQGYLLEVSNNLASMVSVPQILQNFYQYKNLSFDGALTAYNLGNQFKWEMGYKNGNHIYRKALRNSLNFNAAGGKIRHATKTVRQPSQNSTGNSCTEWYLVTYYDDGSYDEDYLGTSCNDCNMTRHINLAPGAFVLDCGGGGGDGDATTTVVTYDTIHNELTNPCYASTFNTMTSSGLQSELTGIFQTTFNTTDIVDYVMGEVPNLSDPSADALTTFSGSGGYITVQTNLNDAQLTNASKEYITETIFHEIIHGYLDARTDIKSQLAQHTEMITSYVDCELAALQEIYPNLTPHDGLCLILGGMGNVQQYDPTTLNAVMAHYNMNVNDVSQTNNYFKTGNCGMRCDPSNPLN